MKPLYRNIIIIGIVFALGASVYAFGGGAKKPAESQFPGKFSTVDLYGSEVTNEIFSEYKATVIDVWGTYCGPCINAMPTLQALYEKYSGEGLNIIGVLIDAQNADGSPKPGQVQLAREIMDGCGADFTSVLMSEEIANFVSSEITAIPTTFIVDSEGNIAGKIYVGGKSFSEWSGIIDEIL